MKQYGKESVFVLLLGFALCGALLFAAPASAQVPSVWVYSGLLLDEHDDPVDGELNFKVEIYQMDTGGEAIACERFNGVQVVNGVFVLQLGTGVADGPGCQPEPLDAHLASGEILWLAVSVGPGELQEMTPRAPIGAVPYAVRAQHAQDADHATEADSAVVSNRVELADGTPVVDADGNWAGEVIPHERLGLTGVPGSPTEVLVAGIDSLETKVGLLEDATGMAGAAAVRLDDLEADLAAQVARLDGLIDVLEARADALEGRSDTLEGRSDTLEDRSEALEGRSDTLEGRADDLETLTEPMTRVDQEIYFTGVNVNIRSGHASEQTDHGEDGPNGYGNLVVGYNEPPPSPPVGYRDGSHNLVVGGEHGYQGFAGVAGGGSNLIDGTGSFAVGYGNEATGDYVAVCGGALNVAIGDYGVVAGGTTNTVGSDVEQRRYASVFGGSSNRALSFRSAVFGGEHNTAGSDEEGLGGSATVLGGRENTASGPLTTIVGGRGNTVEGKDNLIAGGYENHVGNNTDLENSLYICSFGGRDLRATGRGATSMGGRDSTVAGNWAVAVGGDTISASGTNAVSVGGYLNNATGTQAVVVGGSANVPSGELSVAVGGIGNQAKNNAAMVVGGSANQATGENTYVVGGNGVVSSSSDCVEIDICSP